MSVSTRAIASLCSSAILLSGFLIFPPSQLAAETPGTGEGAAQTTPDAGRPAPVCEPESLDSPYIPVDSWVYPAILRLYGLGYIDTVYLGMRPWTRSSVEHMLEEASARIEDAQDYTDSMTNEAQAIYESLDRELHPDMQGPCRMFKGKVRIESVYSVARGISGTPLDDSFHLGQTVINDYDRPYQNGFSNYTGASGYASAGRFLIYVRGEFQGTGSATGYSPALAQVLSDVDDIGSSIPPPGFLTSKQPFPWARSAQPPEHAFSKPMLPQISCVTKSHSASRTTGSARAWAVVLPIPTTPRTSTRSASIALNRCTSRDCRTSSARSAMNS